MEKFGRVRWLLQIPEDDAYTHILDGTNSEYTVCALAYEGVSHNKKQNFVKTRKPVDCPKCLAILEFFKTHTL